MPINDLAPNVNTYETRREQTRDGAGIATAHRLAERCIATIKDGPKRMRGWLDFSGKERAVTLPTKSGEYLI